MKKYKPTIIPAEGGKIIEEYIGRINTNTEDVSIAKMVSPKGWSEPGQTPKFDEYIVILRGTLLVKNKTESEILKSGDAIIAKKDEWVQFTSPFEETEYIAICLPAFSIDIVNRD
jgi:mannose-6-phosphate isomerase-like protein (cupin superfamily)